MGVNSSDDSDTILSEEETLRIVKQHTDPTEPVMVAREVAGASRPTAHNRLRSLDEQGRVRSAREGNAQVYWKYDIVDVVPPKGFDLNDPYEPHPHHSGDAPSPAQQDDDTVPTESDRHDSDATDGTTEAESSKDDDVTLTPDRLALIKGWEVAANRL